MNQEKLSIRGARVHNLKNINLDIPKNKLVVFTGLSGSGKSSLAFDTIYAEGQRRYMESLSSYAKQFLELQDKPDVDEIVGLSPTIAIDQKSSSHNPRSTVGTVTEIYDYLRVLYARVGQPHDPKTGKLIEEKTTDDISAEITGAIRKGEVLLFIPMVKNQKGEHQQVLVAAGNAGFKEVRFDGLIMDLEEAIDMKKQKTKEHDIEILAERFEAGKDVPKERMQVILDRALDLGNGELLMYRDDTGDEENLIVGYDLPGGLRIPKPEPRLFSFNSPYGACPECTGLGIKLVLEPDLVIPNTRLTIDQGAVKPWSRIAGNQNGYMAILDAVSKKKKISLSTPIEKLSKPIYEMLMNGTGEEKYEVNGQEVDFPGILGMLERKYRETSSEYVRKELETYMRSMVCSDCGGMRLRKEVLLFTIGGKTIADVVSRPIEDISNFFDEVLVGLNGKNNKFVRAYGNTPVHSAERQVIERVAKEVKIRVNHLLEVGLGYLTLDRSAMTLSGGESQRVRLATQLGAALSGVIYVLDEPSIGLHPRDNAHLIKTMKNLRDLGNSVIVVEHDEEMIRAADYVFDVGPGAGEYGGRIVAEGTPKQLEKDKNSLTGEYLSGKKKIKNPKSYRKGNGKKISIIGASENNLQNVNLDIPLGQLVCVTGVSGSGKSTLILEILGKALAKHFYRAKAYPGAHKQIKGLKSIDKVVTVDQSPIGRTPRSNPATYTGVFTAIRDLFTEVQEAKLRGYDAGKFSFNVKGGGRCENCSGDGQIRIEMQFMPDVYVDCPECAGRRYVPEVLEIHYRHKNIADVLDMTVDEARRFFADRSNIYEKLNVLHEVGLGYVKLGQSATTLSGGEAQRVKLSTELSRRATGKTLYILDEPTTGLHFEDTGKLLEVLHALVDKGNSILVIEHNPDVMRLSDWIIDMGPEGGIKGGLVIGEGTPKDIAKKNSHTGRAIKEAMK
ncbi:excinuclease ABC subunit UvrA [Candidatus Uhrbacteria bacterium CG_4_9_14_0_2_um_filter_41_50]|uniref:UvrABC system protein A n=1 Tax=Candidatus Uhrbacteria bacterium CG_4_9_14_0_2_um_filter_41_50 TaxID=1975031 RepID=A0A2M8EPT2_9BACT|nr:MAG: excinuclease ABC subunit UvrA [Candidatus Uhrbacteria bacterium CG_4_10_14_3_um_filter_41_21]PIZ54313.1 MAG: excinuclease ABC subunit UvrA [Candidatus Uhrbacteria bacterium CG_4_10_14_0_2_um_filter_41_21]PJB85068.1 MAG: excinuclease ABC subunit UvrA [Candidatus Uhrbacteria bacterium CG_4_9_14_0_8_um_filter_41_16]PJC24746.1 MAG: excinuclease ABC subunit UvrA [Candidatus Uhrbacteria bacterium CG_4_9_14_0_2_um_filter_41_50]PJE75347.1 MAG: excinuclease ABC subunit UvrA [Candidatus Uhrbacter